VIFLYNSLFWWVVAFYSVSSVSYLKTTKTLSRTIVQFCKYLALGTFLSWLFPEPLSAGLPIAQGSAQSRAPRLSFPPGWLSWPAHQVGSQPTVDSSYHREMPLNHCLKWFDCSCKQITAKFDIIPETAMVNQVILALPLLKMGLCYLNLRKVSVPFWTQGLITRTQASQTCLA